MKKTYKKPKMDVTIYSTPDMICANTSSFQQFNTGTVADVYKITASNLHS